MFKEIIINELKFNPFEKISKEWFLITAGNKEVGVNTMTASWGAMGEIWNKPSIFAFIRPQRYTKKFVDNNERFTISFFDKEYHDKLAYLGAHSGADENKIEIVNFSTTFVDNCPTFEEANLVFVCKKAFEQDIQKDGFIDKKIIDSVYKNNDFHTMYVGCIEKIYVK